MRFVIKIGTSLLTTSKNELDRVFLERIVADIAAVAHAGHECVVVSSGAVAAGRSELAVKKEKKNIPFRQALAAVGQGILMKTYHDFFGKYKIPVAQALLTNYDFVNRENFLNTKNVFQLLLHAHAIPIVNENDVTTIAELKFMDNDLLSAKTADMVSADTLIILTDVDGLYREDPKKNPDAKLITRVTKVDDSVRGLAGGARSSKSLGGMITKLEAADYVTSVGISMFIGNGRRENLLPELVDFCETVADTPNANVPHATFFETQKKRSENQKKWLRPKIQKKFWIEIDDGASRALKEMGKSLLPSGVISVHGEFRRGDVVIIKNSGGDIAYGQINYAAADIDKIKKQKTGDIESILGWSAEDEAIHRDRMVVL